MPYRQNAAASAGNKTRPDEADGNGGTNSMQCQWLAAGDQPKLTLCYDAVAVDAPPPTRKQPPSSFPAASVVATTTTATTSKRDSADNVVTTRRRQSSIPSVAKAPMGPRPLDYGGSMGKRYFTQFRVGSFNANSHLPGPRAIR
jgi:hypothetical protein